MYVSRKFRLNGKKAWVLLHFSWKVIIVVHLPCAEYYYCYEYNRTTYQSVFWESSYVNARRQKPYKIIISMVGRANFLVTNKNNERLTQLYVQIQT